MLLQTSLFIVVPARTAYNGSVIEIYMLEFENFYYFCENNIKLEIDLYYEKEFYPTIFATRHDGVYLEH